MSESSREGMRPSDIGGLRQVTEPRVSPDGSTIAFSMVNVDLEANRYCSRVWMAQVDGNDQARPFSAGPDDHGPQWSPDGRWIAFTVSGHEGPSQICLLPVGHGGERVVVATWPTSISELAWSPDGSSLAFVARDPDPAVYGAPGEERKSKDIPPRRVTRFFYRLDSAGWISDRPNRVLVVATDGMSTPRVLTPGPFQAGSIAWSPDGSRIAFASARHDTWDLDGAVDIWTVASDGSDEPQLVTETVAAYSAPTWSPEGSRLACVRWSTPTDEPRHAQLGTLDLDTGRWNELTTDLDRNCFPYGAARAPVWMGDRLLFSVENEGNLHVYSVDADGDGKPEPLVEGERWVASWDWAGNTLAAAVTTATRFPELIVAKLSDSAVAGAGIPQLNERVLTDVTRDFASRIEMAEPVRYVARSADGTEVPCWAVAPVGAEKGKRYPTILNVHGGPFTSYGNRFFDEFQLQVGSGFGVLFCNPRGSSGYTEGWGRAVRWPECENDPGSGWGGVDYEDVMACVEEGCKQFDWVDSDLLGITGGSYGGYMTSWAIGHTNRFKAALSERACNNLLNLEINSDIATVFRSYVGRSHLDDPGAYLRQSPITYVEQISTPVLIVHSEDDWRCPINQAEELFVALRLLGKEPEMVRFPGETHELSRSGAPKHRVARIELLLDWFKEHLGDPAQ
jgi:dipeptidyl aminopeptidase/acylaminoacyl peptidase